MLYPIKRRLVLFLWQDGRLKPKEIGLLHQAHSLVFASPLSFFRGYSTGNYASITLGVPTHSQETISHQISDRFPSPISSGLCSLAFKTSGLAALCGLAGSHKVARDAFFSRRPPTDELLSIKDEHHQFGADLRP